MTNTFSETISQNFLLYRGLFYSPAAYRILTKSTWLRVLSFFILVHVGVALLAVGVFYMRFLPQALQDSKESINIVRHHLPEDLLFSWNSENQELSFIESEENQLPVRVPSTALASLESVTSAGVASLPKYFLSIEDESSEQLAQASTITDSLIVLDSKGANLYRVGTDEATQLEYSLLPQFQESFEVDGSFALSYFEQSLDRFSATVYQAWPLALAAAVPLMIMLTSFTLFLDMFFVILLVKLNQYRVTVAESIKLTLLVGGVSAVMNQVVTTLYTTVQMPVYTLTFWLIITYLFLFNSRLWK
jgi:hypothetical protein